MGLFFFSSCTFVKFLGELFSHQVAFSQKTLLKSRDSSDQPFTVKKVKKFITCNEMYDGEFFWTVNHISKEIGLGFDEHLREGALERVGGPSGEVLGIIGDNTF